MSLYRRIITTIMLLAALLLGGCVDSKLYEQTTTDTTTTDTQDTTATPAKIVIHSNASSVKSDGSTTATITATVLDSSNVVIENASVFFSTTGGQLSVGSSVTDTNGQATAELTAGTDVSNQLVTVTATTGTDLTADVSVSIVGSTVAISADKTILTLGGSDASATLTIAAQDASGSGIYNQTVTVAIDASNSSGTGTLSAASGTTDLNGEFSVTLTGVSTGTVRVTAAAVGATTESDFTVETVAGSLAFTSPTDGSTAAVNTQHDITISVPTTVADIELVTSLGTWVSSGTTLLSLTGVAGTTVTEQISSSEGGTASILVAESGNPTISDSMKLVFVNQTVDANSKVTLQASPTTVAPSLGTTENSSTITGYITDANDFPIHNARVSFSIGNTTGSGEYIDPPLAYSGADGKVTAKFYSGSQSTDANGLTINASLYQTGTDTVVSTDSVKVLVNGTAGAIAIGTGTHLSNSDDNTSYIMPMSLQLTDSGGNPVANADVTLSLWPQEYGIGYWDCDVVYRTIIENEDVNKNLILDTGEDISGDGVSTPAISAAGSIPRLVTTDENGIAGFEIVYLKRNAGFVYNAITASANVLGSETSSTLRFWLTPTKADVDPDSADGCLLDASPFNASWPSIIASAESYSVTTNATTELYIELDDSDGSALDAKNVTIKIISAGSDDGTTAPDLNGSGLEATMVTNADGKATYTYTAGNQAGTDKMQVRYTHNGTLLTESVQITVE